MRSYPLHFAVRKSSLQRQKLAGNHGKDQVEASRIQKYSIHYVDPIWSKRNKLAKELITRMLNKNPDERPSAEEALNSKWLTNIP